MGQTDSEDDRCDGTYRDVYERIKRTSYGESDDVDSDFVYKYGDDSIGLY